MVHSVRQELTPRGARADGGRTGSEHLLAGLDDLRELPDSRAELLLQVANAAVLVSSRRNSGGRRRTRARGSLGRVSTWRAGLSGLLTESAGGGGSHDGGIEANEGWEIYRHGEGSTVVSGRAVGGRAVMQEARAPAASGGAKMTQWGDRPLGPPYLAVTRAQHNNAP